MKRTEEKILKFISEKKLIDNGDNILVALSGGPDSVCLLHFLNKFSKKFKISVAAFHINHKLRGKEADKDESFCRKFTEKLGLKFFTIKKDVSSFARRQGISVEEAGRIIRYQELNKAASLFGFEKIATAHNADDNVETVLLNLIKGAGIKGISGIPVRRENIIRPLLILSKEEIINYLNLNKLDYSTDITNLDDNYERNFLRNKIIPLLREKLNPALTGSVFKSSEVFKEVNSYIKLQVDKLYDSLVEKRDDSVFLKLQKFNLIEKELRGEIIRALFEKEFDIQLSFDEYKKILHLTESQSGRNINLREGLRAFKERSSLIFTEYKTGRFKVKKIKPGESVRINDKSLSVKAVSKKRLERKNPDIEFINGDRIKSSFTIRRWKNGDRFVPFGMKGSKKVSDFLNEQKLTSYRKKEQLVLCSNNKIVWVVGLRLDERFKVMPGTKKIYKIWLS